MEAQVHHLRSMRFILFVCTIMAWGWGFLIMNSFRNVGISFIFLLPAIPAIPLLCLSVWFSRSMKGLQGPTLFGSKGKLWLYFAMLACTLIGFFLARIVCTAIGHPLWLVPVTVFILGLHFLGLVPIFGARVHAYLTALVFCLAALIVPFLVPMDFMLASLSVYIGWQLVIGAVCWLWLVLTAIHILISGSRLRQRVVLAQQTSRIQTASNPV